MAEVVRLKKKMSKDVIDMTKSNIILCVGAGAVTKAGGSPAGLQALSGFMPVIGSIKGAGHSLKMIKKLKK